MPDEPIEPAEHRKLWKERPAVIGRFLAEHPHYEHLCAEVAYILEKRLKGAGIEFSAVTYRAKSLESFVEKIIRKEYKDPFSEITDFAGVRVVYLYASDFPKIEEIVQSEFEIIEKVDKIKDQGADKFGYGAVHFIVRLGRRSSGARYDDLKGLICEIQVRTVSQDAWAIIEHHLVYKQESAVPGVLKRKLNSLAGLFEIADDQFDRVRTEREKYVRQIESKLDKTAEFLKQEINLDTVTALLTWRFPNRPIEAYNGHISWVIDNLEVEKYSDLANLDMILSKTTKARQEFFKNYNSPPAAMTELAIAILFYEPSIRIKFKEYMTHEDLEKYKKFDHLVEK